MADPVLGHVVDDLARIKSTGAANVHRGTLVQHGKGKIVTPTDVVQIQGHVVAMLGLESKVHHLLNRIPHDGSTGPHSALGLSRRP